LLERDLFELLLVARVLERRQLAEALFVAPVLARELAELRVDRDQLLLEAVRVCNFHRGRISFQMRGLEWFQKLLRALAFERSTRLAVCLRENVSPIPEPFQAYDTSGLVMTSASSTGPL